MSDPREAFERALRGDHAAARELLARELDEGWALALRATLPEGAGRGDAAFEAPAVDEVEASAGDAGALALACTHGARLAFARCAPEALRRWRDALAARAPAELPALRLADAQLTLLSGGDVDGAALESVEGAALREGAAATVVEAAATRALVELERGELDAARGHARRAVRMSRTEELVHPQYLAGVTLARVRRCAGQPHVALRILVALERVAPREWRAWLSHERALAGDRAAQPEALDALAEAAPCPWLRSEAALAAALFDPEREAPGIEAWRAGRVTAVPRGLVALAAGTLEHPCLVRVHPARPAVRVLVAGDAPALATSRPGRIETTLSVLALAPAPLPVEALFAQVYGFEFEPRIHRGSLEVLIHRVRDLLGDRASVERTLGEVSLVPREAFAVPDPRVKRTLDDAVLRAIAAQPGATARESAERAGAPLRSVQHALKRLVEDGSCEAIKRGRAVCYRVEDTTFTEPTRVLEWRQDRS